MAGLINPESLSSARLKPTPREDVKDRSAPNYSLALRGEVTSEKETERREYFFSTGLDKWYETLKDKTFKTRFLTMTPEEARAIVSHWRIHFKDRVSDSPDPDQDTGLSLPDELQSLGERIDRTIGSLDGDSGAFIKLSTRSPKDSHVAFVKAREMYQTRLAAMADSNQSLSLNTKLILLQQAVIDSLNVKTGTEALQLLVSSTRVGEDLEYALEPGDAGFAERCSLVLRQWVDIPLWAEFRGFVWNGQLTAIGQYNHPVTFPELPAHVDTIKTDLGQFYESIKSEIPIDRYIIDFAWTADRRVYLVEINPFDGEIVFPASTGLWNWDTDRQQMTNGPLELRIRTEEQDPVLLKNSTDPLWRTVLFQ